ncbi:MAG: methyltransferase domain-containing protein [Deltaproteobacteria bacterium]|nr:methyltransferase domain-containing protein [Deltaproteobacteria bacterium]
MEAATSSERGIVRRARRPPGWVAPGPLPAGPGERADGWPAADEDLCYLCGEWRIFQKLRGHRFSLDDLATAWFALESLGERRVERALDLGCGSGSVLMMSAWACGAARVVGVEAQEVSVGLARRSIAWNGAAARCEVRHGDLRDPVMVPEGAVFELVTGTPPYIPLGDGVVSSKVQRGPACFEVRGGIDDYMAAAARTLAPGGVFVVCHSHPARVTAAADRAGLAIVTHRAIVPREGREPLFSVFALERGGRAATEQPPLVVRDRHGQWTDAFRAVRHRMGMPA